MRIVDHALSILGEIGNNAQNLRLLDPYIERLVPTHSCLRHTTMKDIVYS
jgi:hypothetical protein